MPKLRSFKPAHTIPYGRQTLGDDEIQAVLQALQSPFITQGPTIEAFEKAVAAYCNVSYAVAFANGTAALHGAYHAAGISSRDEVITSPNTFTATANAVLYQGGTPVFADICPYSWNIDLEHARSKITAHTKALAPVHFAGLPVDLEAWYALADAHNLMVIEDACHALGGRYKNRPIGQCRDMAVFSFHPVKSITTAEGGMVVTPHKHVYDTLLEFRSHGLTKDTSRFTALEGAPWEYEMHDLGYNYRMTDLQAALGTVQINKLDTFIARRNTLAQRYREAFADCSAIMMQQEHPDALSAYHLFVIRINPEHTQTTRKQLFEGLVEANIRPQVHYIPVHLQPYYQQHVGTQPGDYPQAEAYYQHCLSLPLFPTLTDEEQQYVIDCVLELLG